MVSSAWGAWMPHRGGMQCTLTGGDVFWLEDTLDRQTRAPVTDMLVTSLLPVYFVGGPEMFLLKNTYKRVCFQCVRAYVHVLSACTS